MNYKTITIFGGTGFLGRYVVNKLCKENYIIKIVSTNPQKGAFLKPCGSVGQVNCVYGNIRDYNSVKENIKDSQIVINLVGILYKKGKNNFSNVHAIGAEYIAKACTEENIERLIHISALGIDKPSGSVYARSKLNGEKAVHNAYPNAIILRPSIIFGPEDNFINKFAFITKISPIVPLIGNGKAKFQPIYVEDVADSIAACLNNKNSCGKIYELGGNEIYSFRELLQLIINIVGKKRFILPLPTPMVKLVAIFLSLFPITPIITNDQIKLLKVDNILSANSLKIGDLGIKPRGLKATIESYL